ncbi:MAG TPA: ATP-binding protein [Thermodesulfobacteriota bacterium]|nr:ATP-binding protein [Thermodesulfobacteriota bacterium]
MSLRKRISLRNTLSFRLTLWYAGIFAVSSCVAFLLFYALITSFIREQTDQDLLVQVSRFSTLLASEDIEAVKNAAVIEAQAAGVKKVFFRLLSLNGQVFSSSNMAYWKNIDIHEATLKELLRGRRPVFETITIPQRREKVRILYAMLNPTIVLQVGQAMESYSRFLDAFKGIFITTMTFLIVVAAGVGWFMARQAVSDVEAVTRTAQKISGGTLEERVPVKARGDEIDQLAITFNQMLDRIQALLTEIKEMGDNMAHDLRSPITRIRGIAEVTLTTGKSLAEFEAMAASTIEECDRLLDLINTMLMISKAEAGVDHLTREEIDLGGVVQEACRLFEPTAEDKGITLSCDVREGSRFVGDSRMIQRMLSNLLDNAIKYSLSGGSVIISVAENDARIVVSVKDTGIGISAKDLPHIFERFYRCDQSRSQTGIGLGLSLARAIARAHGGDITATSALNQGSTFNVILPRSLFFHS